jgi:hypothetical protein
MAIEYVVDVFFLLDLLFSFVKRSIQNKDLKAIAYSYVFTDTFIFDLVALVPLFFQEKYIYFGFKCTRIVHFFRLTDPVDLFL